jgi:peptide-methionine (S)-S-oxide reductase
METKAQGTIRQGTLMFCSAKNVRFPSAAWILLIPSFLGCSYQQAAERPSVTESTTQKISRVDASSDSDVPGTTKENEQVSDSQTATFGGGCFWCTEAVFQQLKGVDKVVSGYMGGHTENPTYQQICRGDTGHAEVIQIEYEPSKVAFETLLEIFWKTHDPTTLNRQGPDRGTQYRSVVFYHSEEQQALAEKYKQKLDSAGVYDNPIVTEIMLASKFYPAEEYHQDYFNRNPNDRYCNAMIPQKLEKLQQVFGDRLKTAADD